MKTKTSHQNRLMWILTIPIRALGKARDFYVRNMSRCADKFNYRGNCVASLPRSFSVNSSRSDDGDDLKELIRAASIRSLANGVDLSSLMQQQILKRSSSSSSHNGLLQKMPRRSCSVSVSMGRIDEEKASVFGDQNMNIIKQKLVFPRSRSYALNKKGLLF